MLQDSRRVLWLRRAAAAALAAGILLSPELWKAERAFPLAPLLPFDTAILDPFIVPLLLVLLLWVALAKRPARATLAWFLALVFLVLADQMRLQPWVFLETALLLACCDREARRGLALAAVMLAGTYIWSGIHKMHAGFLGTVFPWMLSGIVDSVPLQASIALGILVIGMEILLGILLPLPRWRRWAVATAVVLHAGALLAIGPTGHGWNSVVWPWNVAMVIFVVLAAGPPPGAVLVRARTMTAAWLVFLGLPVLSLIGWWDEYLSGNLYSGNITTATVTVAPQEAIDLVTWSMDALNVPPYPEPRVYRAIARSLCAEAPDGVLLTIRHRKTPFLPQRTVEENVCAR